MSKYKKLKKQLIEAELEEKQKYAAIMGMFSNNGRRRRFHNY